MEEKNFKKLLDDSRDYLYTQCDILKLDFAGRLAKVVGLLIMGFVLALLAITALLFLSLSAVQWLSEYMHPAWAYLIATGAYLLIVVLMIVFRKALFVRPLVSAISGILLGREVEVDHMEKEAERLRMEVAQKQMHIENDVNGIRSDIERPTTLLSLAGKLPTIVRVLVTVLPLLRRFFKKK